MSRLERIVKQLGGDLYDGGRRALVPGPGHSAHDRSVSLLETEDGRVLVHCFSPRDDWRAVRDALAARGLLDAQPGADEDRTALPPVRRVVVQPESEDRVARARRWWAEGAPLFGTAGERYLRRRAIADIPTNSDALRFHPRVTSLDDAKRRPALLAAIVGPDGALQGVQPTLLSAHGAAKAAVVTPRRVIGRLMGGAVRLKAPESTLVVAEGVETALSASEALSLPAWAMLSADNLARFEPPPHVTCLIIATDNDPAGRTAMEKLRRRLRDSRRVGFALPPDGKDWNDWAQRHRRR